MSRQNERPVLWRRLLGRYRIAGLPGGRWTVQAYGCSGRYGEADFASWTTEVVAQPGDHVKLALKRVE